ncbi:hypothetical protein [Streptomyces sp. T028]|uniref:hypothetical protein n=1 Tax=Streptomyces sp. T028 TaxID=3394379 RepID=UPI003A88168D
MSTAYVRHEQRAQHDIGVLTGPLSAGGSLRPLTRYDITDVRFRTTGHDTRLVAPAAPSRTHPPHHPVKSWKDDVLRAVEQRAVLRRPTTTGAHP